MQDCTKQNLYKFIYDFCLTCLEVFHPFAIACNFPRNAITVLLFCLHHTRRHEEKVKIRERESKRERKRHRKFVSTWTQKICHQLILARQDSSNINCITIMTLSRNVRWHLKEKSLNERCIDGKVKEGLHSPIDTPLLRRMGVSLIFLSFIYFWQLTFTFAIDLYEFLKSGLSVKVFFFFIK